MLSDYAGVALFNILGTSFVMMVFEMLEQPNYLWIFIFTLLTYVCFMYATYLTKKI